MNDDIETVNAKMHRVANKKQRKQKSVNEWQCHVTTVDDRERSKESRRRRNVDWRRKRRAYIIA